MRNTTAAGGNFVDAALAPSDPTFGFPFEPYSIQRDLLTHLYETLVERRMTVVESPTGTGKSLSLICSSLSFLRDANRHDKARIVAQVYEQLRPPRTSLALPRRASGQDEGQGQVVKAAADDDEEPDWVIQHQVEARVREFERAERELEERLQRVREREKEKEREAGGVRTVAGSRTSKKRRSETDGSTGGRLVVDPVDQFAPEPYFENEQDAHTLVEDNGVDNYTPAVRAMMQKVHGHASTTQEPEEPDVRKVYFASRTHSQLSQFVAELRKTAFAEGPRKGAESTIDSQKGATDHSHQRPVRLIPLGSRQNLCINDEVRRKSGGSNEAIGDLCLELQKSSSSGQAKGKGAEGKKDKRCPYLPPADEPGKLNDFRDRALATVHDLEDIEDLGRQTKTCPYYGSRKAVRAAEVVTLPYNMLLSKTAREALGISLKDHVVIVDEAHNLIDSILQMHSVSVTLSMLISTRIALLTYIQKFKSRFTGANAAYLKQLAVILKGLCEFATRWGNAALGSAEADAKRASSGVQEEMISVQRLLGEAGGAVDQINLLKLDAYLRSSKIARKIGGYVDSLEEEKTAAGRQAIRATATRNLQRIQEFVLSLANAERDGRVLLAAERSKVSNNAPTKNTATSVTPTAKPTASRPEVSLKYMLLSPSESFREVAEEARSVVLAGGTMAPMSDFKEQLFPHVSAERFSTFSCGHVVPQDHIATFAVSRGPTGVDFEFKYDRRKDEKLLDDLGQAIINVAQLVPRGVVVFVPSYYFLHQVQTRWEKTGALKQLARRKKTFWEPKTSAEVDQTLREYAAANSECKAESEGGLLFAVVGAKLSEGINFADDMARAVIICGIPYPNAQSTELKERMAYLNATSKTVTSGGQDAGQVLYNNLAFRAVNQSIGRAIRNINDWAAIILLDGRYQQPGKKAQLPGWLGSNVQAPQNFGGFMKGLARFLKERKQAQAEVQAGSR